ncbi:hypothetical protein NDU88_006576 [Pleurodeles waltl]|uniref:Uncharacterized protein n=1 Tax=Pleurodeles waltl TaxID=8319 RepID=A0AAV7WG17_PLEWA|nr:hypothetical protein NDU88_006576 [Pleurodeles waltl]
MARGLVPWGPADSKLVLQHWQRGGPQTSPPALTISLHPILHARNPDNSNRSASQTRPAATRTLNFTATSHADQPRRFAHAVTPLTPIVKRVSHPALNIHRAVSPASQ